MNITKFKLLGGGFSGIEVEAIEGIRQGKVMIMDHVKRTRGLPLSKELIEEIQGLKYFFLNLTSHWIDPFNKYFDLNTYILSDIVISEETHKMITGQKLLHDIWNHTKINGASIKSGGCIIMGEIEVVEGKKLGLATPFITEEDDVSFYVELMEKMNNITEHLNEFLTAHALPEHVDQEMMKMIGEKVSETERLTDDDMEERLMNKFIDKGIIVMVENGDTTTVHTSTKSIDSKNVNDAKMVDEMISDMNKKDVLVDTPSEEEKLMEEIILEKKSKKQPKGNLASDKNFPDLSDEIPKPQRGSVESVPSGGTIEDLEYSENLGISKDIIHERPEPVETEDNPENNKGEW